MGHGSHTGRRRVTRVGRRTSADGGGRGYAGSIADKLRVISGDSCIGEQEVPRPVVRRVPDADEGGAGRG
jgi:hypothetical protein